MLSPSLARLGKVRRAASRGQARFQVRGNIRFANDMDMRLRLYMRLRLTPGLHASAACMRAGSSTRRGREEECLRALRRRVGRLRHHAGRAGLLPKPEMSILAYR